MSTETSLILKKVIFYDNLWIRLEESSRESLLIIGLSENFINKLGTIEFLRVLPKGRCVNRERPFGSLEHGRKVELLRSPVSGVIAEINEEVIKNPNLINIDPHNKWIIKIKPKNRDEIEFLR